MTPETMSLAQIQSKGLDLLARELGPVGLIRFLQQFDPGSGDYTFERNQWLGTLPIEKLALEIKEWTDKKNGEDNDLADSPDTVS